MATVSSNKSSSELSLQEKLFSAIKNKFSDAEAKKINKDNFLDIYIPSISSGRGTHLFFNTVKGAIKIGYYVRDESFINKVVSNASISIEGASNGLRIIGNPKFDDVEDALSAAFEFLSHISNDRPVNTIIEGEKSNEIDSIEDLATKFRDSFSDEEELAEFISSYLDDFSEDGKIVVLQIEEADLIKSTENHDLLSGDLFTMIGTVDLKSWKSLSKLIGKVESDWVKNEFEEENPASIVLLYCEGNYVYAFSSPGDEFEGLSDEEIETSNELISNYPYDLNEFIEIVKSKKKKSQFEIIGYKNTLQEWEEFYTVNVNETVVTLKVTRRYYDSYWKASISKDELVDALEEFQEDQDLDMAFQFNWNFYKDGEGYNEVEIELLDYDYDALPADCWEDNDKELGELDAYKIFSDYPSTLDDEETITLGNFGSITINFDSQDIFKLKSLSFELLESTNYPEEDDLEEPGDKNQIGMYSYDILECSVQELRKDINRRNISNETKVEIIAYNNTLTEFDEDYTIEIDGQEVWLTISRSYNDSYWKSQLDIQELSNLFNCIQEQGFEYGLDEVLYGREFYAPGDSENSFEIKLKECNEELLPENCFDGGEVNPYFIFDEYECNFEDVDITLRGETERLDIIIDEEYIGSIWSGAYPSK